MRIIVCGGRGYSDPYGVREALHRIRGQGVTLVHGDADGADRLAAAYAEGRGWEVEPHPADWDYYGKGAGPRRNQQMVDKGADLLFAFPGGSGTADCVSRALKAGIPVRHIDR